MPRACTVCTADDRDAIDAAIVAGTPYRQIADRHAVSGSALARHRKMHLSPAIVAVQASSTADRVGSLAAGIEERLGQLYTEAESILAAAKASGRASISLAAMREMRAALEFAARLCGALDDRPQTLVLNLSTSDEWLATRTAVMTALNGFPEARQAVVAALGALGA